MKNKVLLPVVLAVFGMVLTSCQHQSASKVLHKTATATIVSNAVIHKSPNDDRTYVAITLPNQLQVVLVSDPTLESSAASLAVGVGSAQDPEAQPGLAHYLEHMLFLGTQKYPEPDGFLDFVQNKAGSTNAFTSFDKTNFHFQLNADSFDEALDRFSDYFKSPTFDPQFADKERHAVNSEWSMNRAQDGWILSALEGVTANPANPRAHFNVGNLATLVDKKDSNLQEQLKAFYVQYYSANNMRLTLVGKQSIEQLKALAEKYFSAIPNKNILPPNVTVVGLSSAEMGKHIDYQSQKDIKKMYIDFPLKNDKINWRLKANEIINYLITSEEEGTLCQQLRAKGLANIVTAYVKPDAYGEDGFYRIDIDLTELGLKNSNRVIANVFAYVDYVKKQSINEQYFRELKVMREKDFNHMAKPKAMEQAIALTMDQFDFPLENLIDADFLFDHFDSQAVSDVLSQMQPSKARIWHINKGQVALNTIPYFEGKYSVRDITAEEQANFLAEAKTLTFNLPPLNTLLSDKPASLVDTVYIKPHQVISQQGIEAFLAQPEFHHENKGILSVELNVDFAKKTAKNIVLASLLDGVYKKNNITIVDRAERASLGINTSLSGTYSQHITIAGYTDKHEELLLQLLKNFSDLRFTDKDFNEVMDTYKQIKNNAIKNPAYKQAFTQAMRLLSDAQWTNDELLLAANNITLKDLMAYHKAVKESLLLRMFAFGNYSEDTIKTIALTAAKQLPSQRLPSQRTLAGYVMPAAGKKVSYKNTVEQKDNALVDIYLSDTKSMDEQAQLDVLNAVYQNAFFSQLRTNEQLGYIVGSSPLSVDDHAGFAMYVQSSNTNLTDIKLRMDRFRMDFLPQLVAVDPIKIEQFKKAEIANVLQKPTDFYAESKRYPADFWAAHYNFDTRWRYLAALEKVDKENLIALYQKLLLDKNTMHVLIQLKGNLHPNTPFARP